MHGGSLTESLWRDLIADEVGRWLIDPAHLNSFQDDELVAFIRTGRE